MNDQKSSLPSPGSTDRPKAQRRRVYWVLGAIMAGIFITQLPFPAHEVPSWHSYIQKLKQDTEGSTESMEPVTLIVSYSEQECREINKCDTPTCKQQLNECLNAPRFKIPKAYLYVKQDWEGGIQRSIYMRAIFPGMRAWTIANEAGHVESENSEMVRIKLDVRGAETIRQKFERFRKIYQAVRQEQEVEGMEHYRVVRQDRFNDDFYIAAGDGAAIFYKCASPWIQPDGRPAGVRCEAHTRFEGLDLEYSFLRSDFGKRDRIQQKVQSLLESFLVKQ